MDVTLVSISTVAYNHFPLRKYQHVNEHTSLKVTVTKKTKKNLVMEMSNCADKTVT